MPYTPIVKERIYDERTKIGKTKTTIQKYNAETGEVKTITTEKSVSFARAPFIQINKKYFSKLLGLLTPIELKAVFEIIDKMSWQTNLVLMTQEDLANEMDVSTRTVARVFSTLAHHNVIRNKAHGQWMVNPDLAIECKYEKMDELKEAYNNLPKPKEKKQVNSEGG